MHVMYFTEQPMSAYPADIGLEFGATALMFSNKYFDPVAGSRLYNEYLEQYIYAEEMGVEGFMLNEHHNAPFCMQAKCNIFAVDPRRRDQEGEDRPARQSAAVGREPGAARRRAGDDRHDLERPAGLRLCPRRRTGAARQRRQPGLQPRALRRGARSGRRGLDAPGPVPLGGHALPAPRRQPVGGAAAEALSAGVDPRRDQQGDDHLGGKAALSLHRAQHLDRGDQERSGNFTTKSRARSVTKRGRKTAAICSRSMSPTAKKRRKRTPANSCGCRANSPAWRIRCGRARRDIRRPSIAASLSSSRSDGPRARAAARPSKNRSPTAG